MAQSLKAINVVGATIVIQVCLIMIMTIGVFLYRRTAYAIDHSWRTRPYAALLWLSLLTTLLIVFSDDFYAVWAPMLGDAQLFSVSRGNSFSLVFVTDIVVSGWLIKNTGGANKSPFTTILFLLPSLAIFLREPPLRFCLYAVFSAFVYLILSSLPVYNDGDALSGPALESHVSSKWVNISSLLLTMFIGYITRPELV